MDTYYSPSLYHRNELEKTEQALRFDRDNPLQWRERLRAKLKELMGYDDSSERVPLNVRSIWKRKRACGTVEKIVFTSEPRADVPAYMCIPDNAAPPYVPFICLQGHSTGMHNSIAVDFEDETKNIKVPTEDMDYALGCMQRGFAALCIEQRAFGERKENIQNSGNRESWNCSDLARCHDASVQAYMLGKTLAGQRVLDVDRGIDYLSTRNDIAMNSIGVMGNSGGGTTSVYAAAVLDRISYAMPSCSFGTFRDSKMVVHHCTCGYIPRILEYAEMHDVLGLFAPNPVVVVAGREDPIVPFKSVKDGFEQLKEIYRAREAGDRCHLVIGEGGHRFYARKAWPVMTREINRN